MTIGDVLAAIAGVSLIAGSWVALLLLIVFLCSDKVSAAAARIEAEPVRCGTRGLAVAIGAAVAYLAVMHRFAGPAQALPWLLLSGLALIAAVGSAGIVQLIARRSAPGGVPAFGDTLRAAGLYTLAGLFPAIGWLIVTPLALFVSLGAALPALLPRRRQAPARADQSAYNLAPASAIAEGA